MAISILTRIVRIYLAETKLSDSMCYDFIRKIVISQIVSAKACFFVFPSGPRKQFSLVFLFINVPLPTSVNLIILDSLIWLHLSHGGMTRRENGKKEGVSGALRKFLAENSKKIARKALI